MMQQTRRSATRIAALGAALGAAMGLALPAMAADGMTLALEDTDKREYYCQAMFALTATGEAAFADVNGYFYVFVGDEQVGRSKGASFRFDEGRTTASATFETPNAPCAEVDGYVFVVGACMQGDGFADRNACAAAIAPGGVVRQVRAR